MAFYGVALPLSVFFSYLAKRKLGEHATLKDLFLISQEMTPEKYQASPQRELFECDPIACLSIVLLSRADKSDGVPIFSSSFLRAYYKEGSPFVLVGFYFITLCMRTDHMMAHIQSQLNKHALPGKNAKTYML